MARPPFADIRKFKKIEVSLRDVLLRVEKLLQEIKKAQSGKHSKADLEALEAARVNCITVHQHTKQVWDQFWNDVQKGG